MSRRKLTGTAVAIALTALPALGYALSCAFPAEQAELQVPVEPEFEGVSVTLRAGYQHVTLEVLNANGADGYVSLTYQPEDAQ